MEKGVHAMKKAPESCAVALALVATVGGLPGCATPKMGPPDLSTCMAQKTTEYFKLFKSSETVPDETCFSATFVSYLGTMKTKTGEPDLQAAAVAVSVYAQLARKERELADKILAQRNTSMDALEQMVKDGETCQALIFDGKKMRVSCPPTAAGL